MLLIAQVILALQLPFTLVPLIKITSSKSHMGAFANSRLVQAAAWGATLLIFAANLFLCMELIWPHSSGTDDGGAEDGDGAASWSLLLIGGIEDLLAGQTLLLALAYALFVVGAAAGLSLLLWMIITPLKDDYSRVSDGSALGGRFFPPHLPLLPFRMSSVPTTSPLVLVHSSRHQLLLSKWCMWKGGTEEPPALKGGTGAPIPPQLLPLTLPVLACAPADRPICSQAGIEGIRVARGQARRGSAPPEKR